MMTQGLVAVEENRIQSVAEFKRQVIGPGDQS